MSRNRPVFLDLWAIKLPIMGLVSILHRLSGVLLVLAIPVGAYLLGLSLRGPEGFAAAAAVLDGLFARLVLLVLLWAMMHHLVAGVRYLLLDLGLGLDRDPARRGAWATLALALALFVGGGVLL